MAGLVGNLLIGIGANTESFTSGMRKVRKDLEDSKGLIGQFQLSLGSLGTSLLATAGAAISLQAITSQVRSIVAVGQELGNLRSSFVSITGDVGKARQEFSFLVDTSNRLGLDLKSLSGEYRSLLASSKGTNLEGEQTRALFTQLTQASRNYGLSTEQTGRIITAFTQIISKNRLEQEELRGQLSEALPGAVQIASRAFGQTTQDFNKLVSSGIDAGTFVRKFTDQLSRESPASAAVAGGGIRLLGNEILLLKDRIAQSGLLPWLDDVARRVALFGQRLRKDSEDAAAQARAAGGRLGVNPESPGIGPLLTVNKNLREEEARLERLRAANAPQRAIDDTLQAITALRLEQQGLIGSIQQEGLERQRVATVAAQSNQAAGERLRAENQEKASEQERIHARFLEISVSTAEAAETQLEAERFANQETERGARGRVSLFATVGEQQRRYLEGLQSEIDLLTLSQEALEKKRLDAEPLDEPQRAEAERLLEQLQGAREVHEEFLRIQAIATADRLEAEQTQRQNDRQQVDEARAFTAQLKAELRDSARDVRQFADFFSDSILEATRIGETGFKSFADSVIANLLRIAVQQSLTPLLNRSIEAGLTLLKDFVSLGAGVSAGSAAGTEGEGALFGSNLNRASGGPVMPGSFFTVGENGPETLIAGTSGTVIPHGAGGTTINVAFNLGPGSDINSFRRGQAEIAATIMRTVVAAQRHI